MKRILKKISKESEKPVKEDKQNSDTNEKTTKK